MIQPIRNLSRELDCWYVGGIFGSEDYTTSIPTVDARSFFLKGGSWTLEDWLKVCIDKMATKPVGYTHAGLSLTRDVSYRAEDTYNTNSGDGAGYIFNPNYRGTTVIWYQSRGTMSPS
jgi:hypothetical protein